MKDLPKFIIYQPNAKEFHICLEVGTAYYTWWSYYPPTQDNRFTRKIKRLRDIAPKDIPRKQVFDKGTYTVNKKDDKATVEKKVKKGVKGKSFSFILEGKKLKGRFIIKQTSGGTVIQKFKDKFATEEDVLGGDLSRTISLMVPGYDENKVKLNYPKKRKAARPSKKEMPEEVVAHEEPEIEEAEIEELTADKKIGNVNYHFVFYKAEDQPDLCIITNAKHEILVLQQQATGKWKFLKAARVIASKKDAQLLEHAEALYQLQ